LPASASGIISLLLHRKLAVCLFVDYLARGRYHIIPRQHEILGPEKLAPLTGEREEAENPANGGVKTAAAGDVVPIGGETAQGAQPTAFQETKDSQ
jgi:hypothetical protein